MTSTFTGTSGNDSITGGSGSDTIFGGNGTDILYGGTGNATIVGGGGHASILGGSGNDIIYGGTLTSTITGGTGNDSIFGSTGNDIIYGGTGNDTITGGTGNQSITGGSGNDIIYGGPGDNTISGGGGNATISGGGGDDVLTGTRIRFVADVLRLAEHDAYRQHVLALRRRPACDASTISGFQNAILAAGTGDFTLDASGFSGNVILQGGTGDDTLIGNSGHDTLVGGAGNDSLVGGGGNDTFVFNSASSGSQTIFEPAGHGECRDSTSRRHPPASRSTLASPTEQTVIPGVLNLTLADPQGLSSVLGSSYDDTIIGNANNDTLIGGGGLNEIVGVARATTCWKGASRGSSTSTSPPTSCRGSTSIRQTERNEIQAQIEADYADFPYTFTQTQPESGPYTTITFNDPALVGLEGGIATEIDWRNLDIAGTTTLTADGPGGGAPRFGGVNVNNLLGAPGEPAATSADFVGLSATIAAHELGHLSGLQHMDSFGPIGSGIYSGVNPDLYNPPYPGPTDANETVMHIMASGASVNATLEDAIDDPFFGEREAIALAYGEDGSPTNEETTPHYSMADAQPLALEPLVVPDTDLEGVNADKVFDVTAADVVGYLGLDCQRQFADRLLLVHRRRPAR